MEIQLEESEEKGSFYIEADGVRAGQLFFSKGPSRIIISHTEVAEALRGKSAGKQLVAAAVAYARKNKVKIVPLCPFARKVFDTVKDYQDVL